MTEKQDPVEVIPEDERAGDELFDDDVVSEKLEAEGTSVGETIAPETIDAPSSLEPEPGEEPEPETLRPADLYSLGALTLGIEPSGGDQDIQTLAATSPGLRRELALLLPVADILTSLYQAQPAGAPSAPVAQPARGQSTTAMRLPRGAAGREQAASGTPTVRAAARPRAIGGISATTAAIVALALVAAVAMLWALALLDRVSTRDDEIAALRAQVAELRSSANASAFVLTPASDDVPDARGTIFASAADQSVLLDVSGLPELEGDEIYQVWFGSPGSDEWLLGPAFSVNDNGQSVQRLAGNVPGFARVAISREPSPGSPEPSGPFLLEGVLAEGTG